MKILLSYSYYHFDPDKSLSEQPVRNTSAGILARAFYEVLTELGEVTYTDGYRYKEHIGKEFDLFVGIASHFHDILNACIVEKSIYVAVNMHPVERNSILRQFINENNLPEGAISEKDIVDPAPYLEAIERADFILCAGNVATLNSYTKHGVPIGKIKIFNYGAALTAPKTIRSHKTKRFLYLASEIGLRKGFDVLSSAMIQIQGDFHIDIVGAPSNEFYRTKIDGLVKKMKGKAAYHPWIDSTRQQYKEILRDSDFLIFPSLEEGQAGTVIDALSQGLIPVVSENSGIDFSPLGKFAIGEESVTENAQILENALSLSIAEVKNLKNKALEYYQEMHREFAEELKESIQNSLAGFIYPLLSFVLPIFNKEKTIKGLVQNLDAAIRNYPRAELHIIFDGCKDRTEKIVRRFFRKKRGYSVTFTNTPNIFEIKTNNLGLKQGKGKYGVIIQDDNYIYDRLFAYEAVNFLDRNPKASVLGGLAGVNFYPLSTRDLKGPGQIAITEHEVYWRQDANTDPELKDRVFQVDACMRGPLFFRKSFLEEHGYLDEMYAPLYQDDMDICFRAGKYGYRVYCMLMNVENKSLTMAQVDPGKGKFFNQVMERNADIFYSRWNPTSKKDYLWVHRVPLLELMPPPKTPWYRRFSRA